MIRTAGTLALTLLLSLLVGCDREPANPPPPTTQPLLGAYRAAEGSVLEFLPDSRFRSSGAVGGQFSVDGDRITLRVDNGKVVRGTRQGQDTIAVDTPSGPQKMFRVGSTAAQTAEATTPPVPPAPTRQPQKPQPDRSVPLSDYIRLESAADVALLAAAFAEPPLSDEAKLQLAPSGEPADAFARREWAARELPVLNARIQELARSRYIRVTASSLIDLSLQRKDPGAVMLWGLSYAAVNGREPLLPYDATIKGFGIACLNQTVVVQ